MRKILIEKAWVISFFLAWVCCLSHANATVVAKLSPEKVEFGETVRLTLTMEGQQTDEVPDLAPLQKDFSIIGTERSMSYTFMNGQSQSMKQWHIHLMPKKVGRIPIPAISFGQQKSQVLYLDVVHSGQSTAVKRHSAQDDLDEENVILETALTPKKPYMNQQVLLTVRLMTRQRLMDVDYQAPTVANALMVALGPAKQYQTMRKGQTYLVEEQQYAVFPQKSGVMTVEGTALNAIAYGMLPKQVQLRTPAKKLTVKAIPQESTQKDWLPAKKVQLYEHYEDVSGQLEVGDVITRIVTLKAEGIPAQLLPPLEFEESKALQAYPEKPEEQNQVQQANLIGKKIVKVTYIVNKAGKITVPKIKVPWFDVKTGEQKVALLPEKTWTIAEQAQKTSDSGQALKATKKKAKRPNKEPDLMAAQAKKTRWVKVHHTMSWPWMIALAFAFLWLLTLFLWWWLSKNRLSRQKKVWMKQLHQACAENDAAKTKEALMYWAGCQWPEKTFVNLHQVAQQFEGTLLKEQILHLSQILYHPKNQETWQGKAFAHTINKYMKKHQRSHSIKDDLPPINP